MRKSFPLPGRTPCSVPFCRRTMPAAGAGHEIICGKHWRLADRFLTRRYKAVQRQIAALGDVIPESREGEARKLLGKAEAYWRSIKAQAIERAMGAG